MKPITTIYDIDALHHFPGEFWTYRNVHGWDEFLHLQQPSAKRERLNIQKMYGKNSPIVQSMLYGLFVASSEGNNIFEGEDLERLKNAMTNASGVTPLAGDIRAAGDVSGGSGNDSAILMVRAGTTILHVDRFQATNTVDQADHWVRLMRQLNIAPWQFTVDGGGIGAAVADYMEMRLNFRGINRFAANKNPRHKTEFKDRYTEIHWEIKTMLELKCLKVNVWIPELIAEARTRRYVESEGKIKTEPKEQHRKRNRQKSPDYLDTLVYSFSDFEMTRVMMGHEDTWSGMRKEPTMDEPKSQDFKPSAHLAMAGLSRQPSFKLKKL